MAVAAGAYAHIPTKGRWTIKIEPQVQYRLSDNLTGNEPDDQSNTTAIGDQQEDTYTNVSRQAKVLLAAPVMAAYQLSPKTALEAGLVPSYRPLVRDVDKNLPPNGVAPARQADAALGLAIGVEQKLTQKVAVNVRYNRNLTSPSSLKPDSSVMVSARYKF